jgi:hypothetical protein
MIAIQRTFEDLSQKEIRKCVAPSYARRMIALLAVRRCWTTRREFREMIGLDDRQVRLGREAAHGRIAYGQNGLKLIRDLTLNEYREYEARLEKDVQSAVNRKLEAVRRYHGKKTMESLTV